MKFLFGNGKTTKKYLPLYAPNSKFELLEQDNFKTILHFELKNILTFPEKTTRKATLQVTPQVKKFLLVCDGEMTSKELMGEMDLKDRKYFRTNILNSSLEQELIEMTMPEKPNHPNQKYRLTEKGIILRQTLEKEL